MGILTQTPHRMFTHSFFQCDVFQFMLWGNIEYDNIFSLSHIKMEDSDLMLRKGQECEEWMGEFLKMAQ